MLNHTTCMVDPEGVEHTVQTTRVHQLRLQGWTVKGTERDSAAAPGIGEQARANKAGLEGAGDAPKKKRTRKKASKKAAE